LIAIPVVALISSTCGSIISPSFVCPVVTATSRITPTLSSTAGGLQPSVASVRGHRRVGIGGADLLVLAALPFFFLSLHFLLALVLAQHVLDVPLNETVAADVGADRRRIDVHDLSRGPC